MNQSLIYDSPQADSIAKLLQRGKIDAHRFDILVFIDLFEMKNI